MSITFSLYTETEHSLLFSSINDNAATLDKFSRFFSNEQTNPLHFFTEYSSFKDKLLLSLHPAEAPLVFECRENAIYANIYTGITGAGYHAYILDMLDLLGKKYKLQWKEVEKKNDPSRYFNNKDFEELKEYYLDNLSYTANTLLKSSANGFSRFMINVPEDYPLIDRDYFAASTLGYFGKVWFSDFISAGTDEKKIGMAKEFYVWFDRELDKTFWFKTVISMIWLFFPFRPPMDDREKKFFSNILYAFEMAYKLDSALAYPYDVWLLVAEYLRDDAIAKIIRKRTDGGIIASSDIGFCKENGVSEIAGGFSISMPMRMKLTRNDNEGTVEFNDGRAKAIFQVYSFKSENKNVVMKRVIEHIDKAGDKGQELPFRHKEYLSKVYERKLLNGNYLITAAISLDKLALIAWYTYQDEKDRSIAFDSLSKISYIN